MVQNFAVAKEGSNTQQQYDILSPGFPPKILYTFLIPILSLWPSLDVQLGETDRNDTQKPLRSFSVCVLP